MSTILTNKIETKSGGLTLDPGAGGTLTINGSTITTSASVTVGTLNATTLAGTLSTASQTNITSVGTLSSLAVLGDVSIADKIIHTGDTNTAIRFPSADTITLETDGSERMRIDSSGNVGIGTISSTVNLLQKYLSITDNYNVGIILNDTRDASAFEIFNAGGVFNINYGTSNRFTINGTGNVGIGTTAPAVKLDVNGQVRASTGILFGTDTAAANALDDYEEGTWTPSPNFSTLNGFSGVDGSGTYTKIGRLVTATLRISFDKGTSTGDFTITGLPFTVINSASGRSGFSVSYLQRIGQADKVFTAFATENTTTIQPYFTGQLSSATIISVTASDISVDTASVVGTVTYQV
jgi:hypothetical protein